MKRTLGLAGSILLHLIFLVVLLFNPLIDSSGGAPPQVEEDVIRITMLGDDLPKPMNGDGDGIQDDPAELCADGSKKYNGVGLIYSRETGIISSVPESLPAYQAGVRVFDVFMNPSYGDLPPGPAEIKVMRYGVLLTFTIMTQKICADTEKTPGV